MKLTSGTMNREIFEELPFPLYFKVYLFNITNPKAVMGGDKPKLQEIGPYYFEYLSNISQNKTKKIFFKFFHLSFEL